MNRLRRAIHLPRLPKNGHLLKQNRYIRCFDGSKWNPKRGSGQRFRRFVCSLDNSMIKPIGRIFANWGIHGGWTNSNNY
jgi:hypothetical protein